MQDFYDNPIKSSHFDIYIFNNLSNILQTWQIFDIKKKVMILILKINQLLFHFFILCEIVLNNIADTRYKILYVFIILMNVIIFY
jgi:hypothetical protein